MPRRGVKVNLHTFSTSALDGGQWSSSRSDLFILGKKGPDNWLTGPQSRSGRCDEERMSSVPEIEPRRSNQYRLTYTTQRKDYLRRLRLCPL
jgi:hypothetical protein